MQRSRKFVLVAFTLAALVGAAAAVSATGDGQVGDQSAAHHVLLLSVDGAATTFASVPGPPTKGTVTVPFLIGTLSEPGQNTDHKLTAKFTDTCSKAGEDYKIDDVKIDVLKFH